MCCTQKCYDWNQERDNLWRYSVRRRAKILLPISSIVLMVILIVVGIMIMFTLIERHLTQTVTMSALKSLQIKASTIQELQQNDLMLLNSALQSSARTISDMYQDPKYMNEQFNEENHIVKGANGGSKDLTKKNAWYQAPLGGVKGAPDAAEKKLCGYA